MIEIFIGLIIGHLLECQFTLNLKLVKTMKYIIENNTSFKYRFYMFQS